MPLDRVGQLVVALGIASAVGASLLYNTSIALQALEARQVSHDHSLRPSLLGRLARNRRWLGATALGLVGWPLEIAALLLAPLTVVQPCLASGLHDSQRRQQQGRDLQRPAHQPQRRGPEPAPVPRQPAKQ